MAGRCFAGNMPRVESQFAQHVGIAEHLFGEYTKAVPAFVTALKRFIAAGGGGPLVTTSEQAVVEMFENKAAVAQNAAQSAWLDAWSQLDQARAIASQRGRDVATYDHVRASSRSFAAGASFDAGEWMLDAGSRDTAVRIFQWQSGPAELIRQGIDALRAAMPEVAITTPATSGEIPQLRSSNVLWVVGLLVVGALAALGYLAWRTLR